jgi:outer membrane immunogenic protein
MPKKLVALTAAVAALGSAGVVQAADMPLKAPAFLPAPVYNWGGWYAGVNIGYGGGAASRPNLGFADPGGAVGFGPYFAAGGNVTPNVSPSGVIGGGQVGYNWMIAPNWLTGVVADIQGSGMKAAATNTVTPPGFALTNQTNSVAIDWFGTLRAKLGITQNSWLFYLTGGLAYGGVRTSGSFVAPGILAFSGSDSSTKVGWTAGAGVNYALGPKWNLGLEYLYVDLGRASYTETSPAAPGASLTIGDHAAANVGRVTIDYKF